MGAPTGYSTPKTDWATDDVVTAADLNRAEGNSAAIEAGNRTINQAITPTDNTATLSAYTDELAHQLDAIIGKTNWYDAPDTDLSTLAANQDFDISGMAFPYRVDILGTKIFDFPVWDFLGSPNIVIFQRFAANIPAGKSLVVRRARYYLDKDIYRITVINGQTPGSVNPYNRDWGWLGANNDTKTNSYNDESPTVDNIIGYNTHGPTALETFGIGVVCASNDKTHFAYSDAWTIRLGYDDGVPTTTTTTTTTLAP